MIDTLGFILLSGLAVLLTIVLGPNDTFCPARRSRGVVAHKGEGLGRSTASTSAHKVKPADVAGYWADDGGAQVIDRPGEIDEA